MPLGFRFAGTALGPRYPSAANDNPAALPSQDLGQRMLLREALRHFAAHGAAAADLAHSNAAQAFFAGERRDYRYWMAICCALDRRMVAAAPQRRPYSQSQSATPGINRSVTLWS